MYLWGKIKHIILFKSTTFFFFLIVSIKQGSLLQLKVFSVTLFLAARNPVCNSKHRLCTTLNLHCHRLDDNSASSLCKSSLNDLNYSNAHLALCDRCWRGMHRGRHSCRILLWLRNYFPLGYVEGEPWIKISKETRRSLLEIQHSWLVSSICHSVLQ